MRYLGADTFTGTRLIAVEAPVLMVHGEDDITVFPEHSKAMARALERARVPHELVLIKDGEHSLLEPSMRLALYSKLEAFLAANQVRRELFAYRTKLCQGKP